uniref:(northern house mosquito) hypothetical protein n=1 Tax=Culex pipiens TaxID=7175 RepID=A0A8D8F2U9_CULPI
MQSWLRICCFGDCGWSGHRPKPRPAGSSCSNSATAVMNSDDSICISWNDESHSCSIVLFSSQLELYGGMTSCLIEGILKSGIVVVASRLMSNIRSVIFPNEESNRFQTFRSTAEF